uniref:nitrilase-related carbon-nitrogen hydrolase n=1 Tax=Paraburkholderia terrae TaxID=311230 RepID=UPI003EBF4B3A
MEPRVGEKRENVAKSLRDIEEAAESGASLVVLPELLNTGYVFADREEAFGLAEDLPPFDRLLVGQAMAEGIVLLTHDDQIRRYDFAPVRYV